MAATAKADGDMSADQKRKILSLFVDEFKLSRRDAAGLLIASTYLLGNGEELNSNLEKVLSRSLDKFSEDQARSAVKLLQRVAEADGSVSELQREFIDRSIAIFSKKFESKGKWT
jgi:uncharacterized tellurite resistance protein B-like protein